MSPIPGYDVNLIDDPTSGIAVNATDTLYLLDPNGPDTPTPISEATDEANSVLQNRLSAYLLQGGRSVYVQGYGSGYELPELEEALDSLPDGAGQIVAPSITDASENILIAQAAYDQKKIALLAAPLGDSDAQVETLAAAIIGGSDARFAGLWPDYAQLRTDANQIYTVSVALIVAALAARNDLQFHNPGMAAAGGNGIAETVISVSDLKTDSRIQALKNAQVNAFKFVQNAYRNYGWRTLANLTTHPDWWDMSGARTVAAITHDIATVDEQIVFGQIDGVGTLQRRYGSLISATLKSYYDLGALYGDTPADAYSVDVGDTVNPVASLQQGIVTARVRLKASKFAEYVVTDITKRSIDAAV